MAIFSIHLQMVLVLQCVHLHYLCLEITTHPNNVCINISNQVHYRWSGMRKVNTHGRREKGGHFTASKWRCWKTTLNMDGDDANPPGHPASYSPGYQRLQKKPKVASYITLRPYTMLQAILLSLFGVGILSVKILSPVQRLLITKLPRCQKVSTPPWDPDKAPPPQLTTLFPITHLPPLPSYPLLHP